MCIRFGQLFLAVLIFAAVGSGQSPAIRVSVTDIKGSIVTGAIVRISDQNGNGSACKMSNNAYECKAPVSGRFWIEVNAEGFERAARELLADNNLGSEYVFVLKIASLGETVVTIGRTESSLGEMAESISVLSEQELGSTAAPTLDDALRQVPGFSIFRRSSSRNANPTTQGVSLRGVGASGASRSIVMLDGVPLNDPFGGWVQWNRVSPIAIESVEVLRGGASSLYGNSSLSGAIDLVPRKADDKFVFSAETFGGTQKTLSGSMFAGGEYKGWTGDITAGHFQTKGYIPVDEADSGPVDSFAGVRSANFSGRISREIGEFASVFFRPSYFTESRTNGTPLQINRTHSRQFILGGNFGRNLTLRKGLSNSAFVWRLYGGTQVYDQTFSAVSADRATESLTRIQRSPSQSFGFSGQFSTVIKTHTFVAGVEGREVRGSSDETGFANNRATVLVGAGGRERTLGMFAKDVFSIGERVVLSAAVRYDGWKNFRGSTATQNLTSGLVTSTAFADRNENAISPQISVLIHANDIVSFHASASHSFRTPTLNELYRSFRVGNVVTTANENLVAERANNFEGGAGFRQKAASFRATVFLTDIDRAIANVTLSSTPSLITRQRQNAGRTRTVGFEFDAETKIRSLEINAGYLLADSRVTDFPSNTALIDKRIPQVPLHQFTFQTRYPIRDWTLAVQGRVSGAQFDDDLNQFRLEPYFQMDAFIAKRFKEKLQVFVAVENVFNSRYSVGRTPIRTVSSPINARVGVRWN